MKLQFKDVEHLLRLAALAVFALLAFIVVREALVPDDFGLYGHYRASAVEANRLKPAVFAGHQVCTDCHEDVVTTKGAGPHVKLGCEGCHGALAKHASAPDEMKPERPDGRTLCVRCHAANTGKPSWYKTVDIKEHAGEERCNTCHVPHNPRVS